MRNLFAAIIIMTALAAPARAQSVDGVAAVVNDEIISTWDVRQRMRLILISLGVQPDQELLRRVQAQALRTLIDERLQLQEADEYEIEVEQDEIDQAFRRLADQNNATPEDIRRDLDRAGIGFATIEQQLRSEIAWQILVSGRYRQRLRVSEDQIDNRLERLASSAARPRYLISEILVETPAGASDEEARETLEGVLDPLSEGAPFPAVAQQYSAAPSAVVGGDIGWILSGELRPEVEAVVATMEPGSVSDPIETSAGYYIIALRDRRTGNSNPERLRLSQISVPASDDAAAEAARSALANVRSRIESCDDLQDASERIEGSSVADLGAIAPGDLTSTFRGAVMALDEGETTEPMRAGNSVVIVTLCGRELATGDGIPSREQVEEGLIDEQLAMLARRYLRDLRRDATIETRLR